MTFDTLLLCSPPDEQSNAFSVLYFRFHLKVGKKQWNVQMYKWECTDVQMRMYKCTNENVQIKMYKCTNENVQIRMYKCTNVQMKMYKCTNENVM